MSVDEGVMSLKYLCHAFQIYRVSAHHCFAVPNAFTAVSLYEH